MHELARAGIQVDRAPRTVEIMRLDLVQWEPPMVTLAIQCSRGVYIRSLAYDLGQLLAVERTWPSYGDCALARSTQTRPFPLSA